MRKTLIRKYWQALLVFIGLGIGLSACSSSDDDAINSGTGNVTVKLEINNVETNQVSFSIIVGGATDCAWKIIGKNAEIPSAEKIMAEGTKANIINDTAKVIADNLEADSTYAIVAVAKDDAGHVSGVSKKEFTTKSISSGGLEFTQIVAAQYTETNDLGNYTLVLASGNLDANDMPARVGDVMMQLDLFSAKDSDPMNATLPDGTYKMGKDEAFTFNPSYTYMVIRTEEATESSDGLMISPVSGGDITVTRSGDTYNVDINSVLLTGDSIHAHFKGSVAFTYQASSQYEKFADTQNITFEHEQGRYWGNFFYPHCDDLAMEFFAGTITDGSLTDGYYLYIPAFMPKLADYNVANPPLHEGVYNVCPRKSPLINWVPFEIQQGERMTVFESETLVGAYLIRIDGATGKRYLGLVDSGTMTVKTEAKGYSIDFDFKTPEGIALKGTYNGTLALTNYNDNDKNQNNIPHPWSTLDGDVNLKFHSSTTAAVYFMGESLKSGYYSWRIDFASNPLQDDYITVELLTPKSDGAVLASREYVVSDKLEAYQLIPGFWTYGGGEVAYCWYGDMNSLDGEGYSSKLAPINGGTMKVTKHTESNYTFDFNFVDDANHAIKGAWTGTTNFYDATSGASSAKVRRASMVRGQIKANKLLKVKKRR